jgi:hypothetical protein
MVCVVMVRKERPYYPNLCGVREEAEQRQRSWKPLKNIKRNK